MVIGINSLRYDDIKRRYLMNISSHPPVKELLKWFDCVAASTVVVLTSARKMGEKKADYSLLMY